MVDQARVMDLPADLETETMVGVRLSVPLPLWNRNQGEIAETTAARARAVAELQAPPVEGPGRSVVREER